MTLSEFQESITAGIPDTLPAPKPYDTSINHAPKRKDILTPEQKELALANALRYLTQNTMRFSLRSLPRSCASMVAYICIVSVPSMRCMRVL